MVGALVSQRGEGESKKVSNVFTMSVRKIPLSQKVLNVYFEKFTIEMRKEALHYCGGNKAFVNLNEDYYRLLLPVAY